MKKLLLLLTIVFLSTLTSTQAQQVEECAADLIHQRLMESDPLYAQKMIVNEQLIKEFVENPNRNANATVLEIPVVVHIIHSGQAVGVGANISMTQINSAITRMNNRYRNLHGVSVDTDIEFVLAQRDPDGNATTGVNRVDGSGVANYSADGVDAGSGSGLGADEQTIKALSKWPNTDYYNIWVITEIEGNNGGGGIQGYAYFPGASPAVDGTIIMHTCFGTTGTVNSWNNQGRTLVHELGHGFNLAHTFQGDSNGTICPPGAGDNVSDTEPHIRAASNCPTGINPCTGVAYAGATDNFMNYSNQSCALEFTTGQSDRMRAAVISSRPALTTSLGGTAPSGASVSAASCTPSTTNTNNGFGLGVYGFAFGNIDVVSSGTVNEGDYVDHTNHQTILTNLGDSYPITIDNLAGGNPEDVAVFIDYNNNGDFSDAGETVFTSTNALTHTGNIVIPISGVTTGTLLRMRVISDFTNNTITGPCYNPQYGQTEDYAMEISDTLSNPELSLTDISIYPNPTAEYLNINGLNKDASVTVYNLAGQLVKSDSVKATNSRINVSELASGIYFLNIDESIIKFIKE